MVGTDKAAVVVKEMSVTKQKLHCALQQQESCPEGKAHPLHRMEHAGLEKFIPGLRHTVT